MVKTTGSSQIAAARVITNVCISDEEAVEPNSLKEFMTYEPWTAIGSLEPLPRIGNPLKLLGMISETPLDILLDSGAMPSIILEHVLARCDTQCRGKLLSCPGSASGFGATTRAIGVYNTHVVLPYPGGSLRLQLELWVRPLSKVPYEVLFGEDTMLRYAINVKLPSSRPSKTYFSSDWLLPTSIRCARSLLLQPKTGDGS